MAYFGCGIVLLAVFLSVVFEPGLRGYGIVLLLATGGTMVIGPASGFFELKGWGWRTGGAAAIFLIIFRAAVHVLESSGQ